MKHWLSCSVCCLLLVMSGMATADTLPLRETYQSLRNELANSAFRRPIHMDSKEAGEVVEGSVYAVLDVPFDKAGKMLALPTHWCDILFLHPNTKYCRARDTGGQPMLEMRIGKKFDQPPQEAYELKLAFAPKDQSAEHLLVELSAAEGPLSTRDYRIVMEAIPVERGKTFLHFSYAYGYGTMGRMAMQGYLGTVARRKVGFTVVGKDPDGSPRYVKGMRGLVERNTMRYYLAIESVLRTPSGPKTIEKQLRDWFAATERYPRQLRDTGLDDYLKTKLGEYRRQQQGAPG